MNGPQVLSTPSILSKAEIKEATDGETPEAGRLTAEQAAQRAGVALSTFTAYVSRGQAPPSAGFNPRTGRAEWTLHDIEAWLEHRPRRKNNERL